MRTIIVSVFFLLPVSAVFADEIGGDWCSATGAHVRIEGSRIQTPGGQWIDGQYSRHAYSFVIPDGETDAGLSVDMRQLSERRVLYAVEGRETEEWTRCQFTS